MGWSMSPIAFASRMANGSVSWTSPAAVAKARMSRSSSGNLLGLQHGVHASALVEDHVVDRVVDGALGLPSREARQQAGVRLPAAELLEALVVRLRVRHEADLGARARARDHAASEPHD